MSTSSPIVNLHKLISGAPSYMAQEQTASLKFTCESKNVLIEFTDQDISPRVGPDNNGQHVVTIGNPYLERMWSHTYFHICITDKLWNMSRGTLNPSSAHEYNMSETHLNWALNPERAPWPIPSGFPVEYTDPISLIDKTTELFLCSCGFVIHHEVSHVEDANWHSMQDYESSRNEEKIADFSAFMRILPHDDIEWKLREKRCLGIVNWYLCSVAMLIHHVKFSTALSAGVLGEETHPRITKRLRWFLTLIYKNGSKEMQAASMVWIVVQYLLSKFSVPHSIKESTNLELAIELLDLTDSWIDSIAKNKKRS